ncbi:MAG TPA: carboxypeptidase-like regulatory domain-containing protein [Pyrinomonadaceae bacterium]|nr:carboxypeptidase-like regulatory domain-containing protein [Pyrinomonadaceae bacterium]
MFRKNYFTVLFLTALFFVSGISVFAQNAPISGRVELTNADGTKTPVAGALVEIFRLDQKIKLPTDKTDKKGNFAFAGVTLGGKYALAVSGEGIAPAILPSISPGAENVLVSVSPGDGKRWTEEEVKQQLSSRTTTNTNTTTTTTTQTKDNSEEAKKREEEIRKQNEENERIKKSNEIRNAALKEGNAAFEQKNYDLAIAKYQEGFDADPTFVPGAIVLLNNMATSLINRAGLNYNTKVKTDKPGAQTALKTDSLRAVEASDKVLEMLKTASPKDEAQKTSFERQKILAIRNRKDAYFLTAQYGEDISKADEIIIAYNEYFTIETIAEDKLKNRISFAGILLFIGKYDMALAEYETMLAENPDNLDGLVGAGTALLVIGGDDSKPDKAKLQSAANYLQKFVDTAPATHPKKAEAVDMLNSLKNQFKVTPQKGKK